MVQGAQTAIMATLRIVSYNPMSTRQTHRLQDFLQTTRPDVLLLQGTRSPMPSQEKEDAVQYSRTAGYHVYTFGCHRLSNNHSGVVVAINAKKTSEQKCNQMSVPDAKHVMGRGGAVRVKHAHMDVTFVSAYLPPNSGTNRVARDYLSTMTWPYKLAGCILARSLLVVGVDANDRLGLVRDKAGWASNRSSVVGPCQPECQSDRSQHLVDFMERFDLVAINTYYDAGGTFFPPAGESGTRIDYILISRSFCFTGHVKRFNVMHDEGDALQLVPIGRRIDHRPLAATIGANLDYTGTEHVARCMWGIDKVMAGVLRGDSRFEFLCELNKWCEKTQHEWLLRQSSATEQFHFLVEQGIRPVAMRFFAEGKGRGHYVVARYDLLGVRRTLKRRFICCGQEKQSISCPSSFRHGHVRSGCLEYQNKLLMKKKEQKEKDEIVRIELQQAWRSRQLAVAWRLARILTGKRLGSKLCHFGRTFMARMSGQQWTDKLRLPGSKGGWNASVSTWDQVISDT